MLKKRGITVSMLATMIAVMIIISSTVVSSVKQITNNSKLRTFATEFAMVNDEIRLRNNTSTDQSYIKDAIVMDLSAVSDNIRNEQFIGENIVNNKITVQKVDIKSLGFNNSTYGKQKTELDIYGLSLETGRLYYVEGIKVGGTTYYTLTQELEEMIGSKYSISDINKQVVFKPSELEWTANAIKTEIAIPLEFENVVIQTSLDGENVDNVSNITEQGGKKIATANIGEKKANYTVNVTYKYDGQNRIETFNVKNHDSTKPTLTHGEQVYKVFNDVIEVNIPDIKASDNESGVLKVKYEADKISQESAKGYFESRGKDIKDTAIVLDPLITNYTLYVEDKAGNYTVVPIYNPTVVGTEAQLVAALSKDSSEIKIINDIACSNLLNIQSGNHSIDLNGHTISYTNNTQNFTFMTINSGANVTIKDNSSSKSGKILAQLLEESYNGNESKRTFNIYTVKNNGIFTIESGEVASKITQNVTGTSKSIDIADAVRTIDNVGTLNVNGGKITASIDTRANVNAAVATSEALGVGIQNSGTINLNSGSINVTARAGMERTLGTFGKSKAYAYGITTTSTSVINRADGFTISVTAENYDTGNTYSEDKEAKEII